MKKFFSICLCTVLMMCALSPLTYGAESERGIIYVATNGKDSNDGSINKPLATLHAARDKIRDFKKQGITYPKGFVVYVREGKYSFEKTLEFTKEDSGTEQAPIVYRAYPGEKVTLLGGVEVSGNIFKKVNDKEILERIVDTAARDKIYMLDLKKRGVNDIGEPYLYGVYSYIAPLNEIPSTKKPNSPAMELLFNGEAMHMARYPNSNNIVVDQVIEEGFDDFDDKNTNPWGAPFSIRVSDNRLQYWTNVKPETILMYGFFGYDWADQAIPMKSIDPKTGQIDSLWSSRFGIDAGKKFYVYNLLEELDAPGEYYIDPDTCILYCYPPSDISKADILLTLLDAPMFKVNEGADYIKFRGLEVKGTRNHAFILNGKGNEISNCEISYNASTCVEINGEDSGIRDSYLHEIDTGVDVWAGYPATLKEGHSYAINNEFYRFSRLTKTYAPAISVANVGNLIMHNKIHSAPHEAIAFSGNNNLICYNEVYDAVRNSDDAAAIYGGINWQGRGNQIKYNYLHDINTTSTSSTGCHAIYLDGGQCETFLVGNIVENASSGFMINGGRDNIVLNNIVIDSGNGLKLTDEMLKVDLDRNHYNNIKKAPYVQSDLWKKAFPKLAAMLTEDNKIVNESIRLPEGNIYQNNVLVNTPLVKLTGVAEKYLDASNNYTTTSDPGFYDYANKNFLLKEDSVVYKELPKFMPLPFTRMGKIDELADKRVQDAICLVIDSPNGLVYGKKMSIDSENPAVTPKIIEDRTFVPLRFVSESLGLNVDFNSKTEEITIAGGDVIISLYAGNREAKKNGETFTMENSAVIEEGRTLVPLREISNLFGKKVFWHDMGFIAVSDDEALFDAIDSTEETMLYYLHGKLNIF